MAKKPRPSTSRITPDEVARIHELKAQGWTVAAIAKDVGRAMSTVHRVHANVKPPKKQRASKTQSVDTINLALAQSASEKLDVDSIVRAALSAGKQIIVIGGN